MAYSLCLPFLVMMNLVMDLSYSPLRNYFLHFTAPMFMYARALKHAILVFESPALSQLHLTFSLPYHL